MAFRAHHTGLPDWTIWALDASLGAELPAAPELPCPLSAVGWTVQVVDRPTQGHLFLSRQYVQPQWVLDSANFRVLANAELYAPGKHPPPHLSPFVSYDEDGYVPEYAKAMLKLQVLPLGHIMHSAASLSSRLCRYPTAVRW